MSLSKSQALQTRLGLTSSLLRAATKRVFERADLPRLIPAYLLFMHQMTRTSVPLMETACEEAKRAGKDLVCRGLRDYLLHHIEEERHHDQWFLEDLISIGFKPIQSQQRLPSTDLASLVGSQYYWIRHHHPVALLGYIAMLEGNAPSVRFVGQLQAQTGLPPSAFRMCRIHAMVDETHQETLNALIDSLPLDARHEQLIAVSGAQTGAYFAYCLAGLEPWEEYTA
jgi:Iron-containing redox enzyme